MSTSPDSGRDTGLPSTGRSALGRLATRAQSQLARLIDAVVPTADPQTADDTAISRWVARNRSSLSRLVDAVAPLIDRDGVIVDVGANVGLFSELLMQRVKFTGVAHLFEPVPNLAAHCGRRFREQPNVSVHSMALGDADGVLPLYTATNGNLGWNTMVAGAATGDMHRVDVPVQRYDDLGLPAPTFVKIDVEGAEHRVIRGMIGALSVRRPPILCEVGWGDKHPEWARELEAFDALRDLGYRATDLHGRTLDIAALSQTTDVLLAVPRR